MHLRRHPTARCPSCGDPIWFGLKAEGTGWKVLSNCRASHCAVEITAGYISMSDVTNTDEAYQCAEDVIEQW